MALTLCTLSRNGPGHMQRSRGILNVFSPGPAITCLIVNTRDGSSEWQPSVKRGLKKEKRKKSATLKINQFVVSHKVLGHLTFTVGVEINVPSA